ncbi:serine/threonine-protein kinase [Nonomuraea sp. NPDC050680]|uniref:serine/threonine-protein kinase n=1 Tax=Nonomuraea sp. NPDC050680 TaxID=3154630 RepID=UPI0033E1E8FA
MSALVPGDPRQLGEYWLAGRLGEGGQGVVYEAYDPAGQRVAIKVLHPGAGAELRERFAKEAAATRQVSAFCTARVLSVELGDPRPYIVSEYVGGPSLRRAVATAGPYRPDDLHRLATGIATALTAIHQAGVIHRDLKPDNVLIGPDGPRVIDFGIARTSEMSLTPTGQVAGTPAFMAPESVIGQRASPAVDVWAWGAVVVYAATGRDPFTGENLAGLLHQILAAAPDVSGLAEPLRALVTAALAKDPGERPSSRSLLLALVGGRDVVPRDGGRDAVPSDGGQDVVSRDDGETRALLAEGSRAAEVIRPPALLAQPPLELVAEQIYRRLRGTDQASALAQRELTVLPPPPAAGADARFDLSADGRVLAVADAGRVTLREAGRTVRTVDGVGTGVRVIALSGDQTKIAVCGPDGVRVWDVATGQAGPRIAGTALGAVLSRDGRLLGLATAEGRGEVRDARTGKLVMGTRDERIDRITLSDDGRYAAATFTDARYELWELGSRRRIGGTGGAVAFGPGTAAIATGGEIRLWDLVTRRFRPDSLVDGITAAWLSFSADGRLLISYDRAAIAVWDVATGDPTLHYPLTDTSGMPSARLDAGHTRLSYLLGRGAVAVLDLTAGVHVAGAAAAAAFDPAGRVAALQTPGGLVLWDVTAGRSLGTLGHRHPTADAPDHAENTDAPADHTDHAEDTDAAADHGQDADDADGAYALAFSPDGRTLATGSAGTTTVTLWNVANRTELARLPVGGRQYIDGLAFSPDGRTLAVSPAEGRAELWDVSGHRRLADLPRAGFDAMAFRPDGKTLAIGGSDAALIDLTTGNVLRDRPFGGSVDGARSLAYAPDGATIAVGFRQLGVDLWDGLGRRQLGRLAPGRGEFDTVMAIAFQPGGAILATGGSSGRVQLWDVAARTSLGDPFKAHAGGVLALGFSADGRRLHSIAADGTIYTVPVDPALAVARICARAGADLTPAEWDRFIPEIPFREVC